MKQVAIAVIRLYQAAVSPHLPPSCRYRPSCSQYAIEAFQRYGLRAGGWRALKRLLRCHPWGGAGEDPL